MPQRARRKLAIDRGERIVERVHENAAHGVDEQDARAALGFAQGRAVAWRTGGKIDRAKQLRRAFDEDERFLLIPGMIAAGDGIGACIDQFAIDRFGDAETAGGVLAIDRDEIELPVANETGQALNDDGPPAAADDIADEQNAHAQRPPQIDHLTLG